MTDFQNSTSGSAQGKADQAKQEAGQLGQTAKQQAAEVKDTAVQATSQVADTAKQEAAQVVDQAKDQIRGLIDTTLGEVRGRTKDGQSAVANTIKSLADELGQMTGANTTSGPVAQFAGDLADRGNRLSTWLENSEPDDVLVEVRRYAARRPGAFLAIAAGAGLLVGRLARGTKEVVSDEKQSREALTTYRQQQFTGTQYAGTEYTAGYQRPVGYDEQGYPREGLGTSTQPFGGQQDRPYDGEGLGNPIAGQGYGTTGTGLGNPEGTR